MLHLLTSASLHTSPLITDHGPTYWPLSHYMLQVHGLGLVWSKWFREAWGLRFTYCSLPQWTSTDNCLITDLYLTYQCLTYWALPHLEVVWGTWIGVGLKSMDYCGMRSKILIGAKMRSEIHRLGWHDCWGTWIRATAACMRKKFNEKYLQIFWQMHTALA